MHATLLTFSLLAPLTLATPAPALGGDSPQDIVTTAVEAGTFKTLAAALSAADLVGALQGEGPFTVLAPTDEAFARIPEADLKRLLEPANKAKLVEILSYHVIPGRVSAAEAIGAASAASLAGPELSFAIEEGRLRVNGVDIVANDVAASNGVIHVVDRVLVPPSGLLPVPRGRKVIGVYTSLPSEALAAQLDLDRHRSLLITGLTDSGNARKAGLQRFDVVTAINGSAATEAALKEAKERAGFGGRLELTVIRKGQQRSLHVEVGVERH